MGLPDEDGGGIGGGCRGGVGAIQDERHLRIAPHQAGIVIRRDDEGGAGGACLDEGRGSPLRSWRNGISLK